MTTADTLHDYARQDALTDPAGMAPLYDELPAGLPALFNVMSGLMVHTSWAAQYGIPPETPLPRDTKPVAERLAEIQQRFAGPLIAERPPTQRPFGTCRDFALLACSALRHRSIPARVRCGFATYFAARRYTDHWICEYWKADEDRWAMADAQLDQLQRDHLAIAFDCSDLPAGAFLSAATAWQLARSGAVDAHEFGHGDVGGLWFLSVDLHRDLLALANCHMSAWDTWRSADEASKVLSDEDLAACDRLAGAVIAETCSGCMSDVRILASRLGVPPWHRVPAALEQTRRLANSG
jgi:Transglutaminase-like superfamily